MKMMDIGLVMKKKIFYTYSKGWIDAKIAAYNHLKDYLKEHGYPEYSVIHVDEFGEKEYWDKDICGYSLIQKKENLIKNIHLYHF